MKELHLDDVALLRGFNSRDKQTINRLHGLVYKKFYWFAFDFLKDRELAHDAVTDAFLAILNEQDAFISMINIYAWLYNRVRWNCLDILKRRTNFGTTEELADLPDDDPRIDDRKIKAEVYHAVLREIERLPDRDKQILKLYFFEELTTQEIAGLLGMNVKTVHNVRSLLLKSIKNELVRKSLTVLILGILFPVK